VSAGWRAIHPGWRLAGLGLVVAAGFCAVGFLGPVSGPHGLAWISGGAGARAAVVFVVVYIGLTMSCVPGPVIAGLSGALFGTLEGTLLALSGAVVGAVLCALVARHVAGDLVARVGGRRVRGFADWVGRRGLGAMICARAAPGAPFSPVSYAAGLTRVRLGDFVLATALVAAPRTFAYAAVGGSVHRASSPVVAVAGAIIVGMAVLGLVLGAREGAREGVALPGWLGGRASRALPAWLGGRTSRALPGWLGGRARRVRPTGSGCVDAGQGRLRA
jgi:uncharacterized membrane protein YdjX (TVP38/TMEM64 family)